MITFARGLVLREGDRSMEFERQLEFGKIQFKYLDNFEIRTFSLGSLYCKILSKAIQVVHQNGHKVGLAEQLNVEGGDHFYSLELTKRQDELIEYRMRYVRAAVSMRATPGSRAKCAVVIASVKGRDEDASPPSPDTLRLWLKRYQESGFNPYALMDRRPLVRKPKRLIKSIETLLEECIAKHYLQLRGLSAKATFGKFKDEVRAKERLEGEKIPLPSERTCHRRIHEIDPYIRDYKRYGASYARNRWRLSLNGDQSTRVLQRVEIDHTWLDIWVLDPKTGVPIGRPWITVVLDRYSGYILGLYISFYGPSVASVAHAIKNSIFPKDELIAGIPEIVTPWTSMGVAEMYVVDNGLEFHSNAFKRMAWDLRADLLYNPVHQPWLKASIERSMMEFNRVLPQRGKVYTPQKNMIPQDPKDSAAILFDDLCVGLFTWAAEVFPRQIHPKNLVRPLDLWEEGRQSCPLPMFPLGFERFDITAGVSTTRTVDGDGVFFKYLRFNSYELQDYRRSHGLKFTTEIRFNPDNLERIHVLLPKTNAWMSVQLKRPAIEYGRGLSLIQHEIIRGEAGKKLTRMNAVEELAAAQARLNDQWGDAITRGVKVRRDGNLVRFQGYTSAKVVDARMPDNDSQKPTAPVPHASSSSEKSLSNVMPFKAFSLTEEFA
ncbi:MAG: transposase [Rhodoferax sp.]